jgi:prevent-host-death family protein
MNTQLPISEFRENLGEIVNQAFYSGKLFGVSKGNKPMGVLVGAEQWKEIIRVIEEHNPGLADTLAIMADPDLQRMLEEGDREIAEGNLISWEQVTRELEEERLQQ